MNAKTPIVVIGTSLGEASDPVVATGARLARRMGAAIYLVHAVEVPTAAVSGVPFAPLAFEPAPGSQELEEAAREGMKEQIARLGIDDGEPLVQHVEPGPAHRVLSDAARREAADLIVVGAADTLAAHLFGSTASRVVRKAQSPVLVLRGALPVPPVKVLLPVDLSPIAVEVVTRGLALLDQWREGQECAATRIEALHVVVPAGYEGFVPHFDLEGAERAGLQRLGELLRAAGCEGRQIARLASFGGAREEILNRIADTRPDLVIMGTHGLSGFDRFTLGSVAEAVARSSKTSVLVIPPRAARGAAAPARAA